MDSNRTVYLNGSWILVWSAVHNQSASIFLFLRFSASNEPAGFDGNVSFCRIGGGGGGGGGSSVRAMIKMS